MCAPVMFTDALTVARRNAQVLKATVDFYQGDWYQALPAQLVFDVIVSNPPYIAAGDGHLTQATCA